jgi:hypothetical protein
MRTELQRDHAGRLYLTVDGSPVPGAVIHDISRADTGAYFANITIPLANIGLAEVKNVIPLVRVG